MVVGASGGSRIISAVAQIVIRTLLFNQTVKEAMDAPRLHNQYMPYVTEYELSAPQVIPFKILSTFLFLATNRYADPCLWAELHRRS